MAVLEDQLSEFIEEGYAALVASLQVMCGNRALAEEFVQEALARALDLERQGRRIEKLRNWVAVVSRNLARSGMRRHLAERRATERLRNQRSPADIFGDDDHSDLLEAVRRLRPKQQEAIALFYFAGMSVADIAQVMQLHQEAVKGLLHRGRDALARALACTEGIVGGRDATHRKSS